jgi:hypothetical protein
MLDIILCYFDMDCSLLCIAIVVSSHSYSCCCCSQKPNKYDIMLINYQQKTEMVECSSGTIVIYQDVYVRVTCSVSVEALIYHGGDRSFQIW